MLLTEIQVQILSHLSKAVIGRYDTASDINAIQKHVGRKVAKEKGKQTTIAEERNRSSKEETKTKKK